LAPREGRERWALARGDHVVPVALLPAVAACSFLAGAAAAGLARRRRAAALAGSGRRSRHLTNRGAGGVSERLQIVSSRTLLVDLHLLGRPEK
jgi:hypothetical protein